MTAGLSENYWPSAEFKQFLFLNVYDGSPLYRECHLMQMLQWPHAAAAVGIEAQPSHVSR
jgi:hypothetical protein